MTILRKIDDDWRAEVARERYERDRSTAWSEILVGGSAGSAWTMMAYEEEAFVALRCFAVVAAVAYLAVCVNGIRALRGLKRRRLLTAFSGRYESKG